MFDTKALIREVLDDTDLDEPGAVAVEVARRTPDDAVRSAYEGLLRQVVVNELSRSRDAVPRPVRRVPNRSSRVAAVRSAHERWLAQRVLAQGVWKRLGACDVVDVLDLAAQRREVAARNAYTALQYEELARRMKDTGAVTVADLPEDVEVSA